MRQDCLINLHLRKIFVAPSNEIPPGLPLLKGGAAVQSLIPNSNIGMGTQAPDGISLFGKVGTTRNREGQGRFSKKYVFSIRTPYYIDIFS